MSNQAPPPRATLQSAGADRIIDSFTELCGT